LISVSTFFDFHLNFLRRLPTCVALCCISIDNQIDVGDKNH